MTLKYCDIYKWVTTRQWRQSKMDITCWIQKDLLTISISEYLLMVYISMLKSHGIFTNNHSIDFDTQILWNLLVVNYYSMNTSYNGHSVYKKRFLADLYFWITYNGIYIHGTESWHYLKHSFLRLWHWNIVRFVTG
jgi:hypothetical protein